MTLGRVVSRAAAVTSFTAAIAVGCSRAEPPAVASSPCVLPPPASDALGDWLRGECYAGWPAEAAVHASSMNPSGIRVFLSPSLAESVARGDGEHPVGAAAVREIYTPDHRTRVGWSASVKTETGWYWYEEFDRHGRATVTGREAPGCTGCHESGRDLVQTRGLAAHRAL